MLKIKTKKEIGYRISDIGKGRKELIDELTYDREFKLISQKWVSGGIAHYTKPMLEELYKVSRPKKKN